MAQPEHNTQHATIEEEKTMKIHWQDTAILFTDPQNEVSSEQRGAWQLVRDSVHENKTVENMERILQTARETGFEVLVSPTITSLQMTGGSSVIPLGR